MKFNFHALDVWEEPEDWTFEVNQAEGEIQITTHCDQEPFLMALMERSGYSYPETVLRSIMLEVEREGGNSIYPLQIGNFKVFEIEGGYEFKNLFNVPLGFDTVVQILLSTPGMRKIA